MTTFKRIESWFRPLHLGNKVVATFKFYNLDGVVFDSHCGWFSDDYTDCKEFTIDKPIRRANKLNFAKNDMFYISSKSGEKGSIDVYIPIEFLTFYKFDKRIERHPNSKSTHSVEYGDKHSFSIGDDSKIYRHWCNIETVYSETTLNRNKVIEGAKSVISDYELIKILSYIKDNNISIDSLI